MAISKTKKGIFCIEGLWDYKNIEDRSTIMPILNLLETGGFCKYIFNNCATITEFEYYLGRWKLKTTNEKYPILYLAFHGEQGCIFLKDNEKYSLEELSSFLGNKCMGKIIYFGSCSTLNIPQKRIDKFLENTGAIAAIGYKSQIGWIQSTACDLFVFEALQSDKLDTQGIRKMHKKIITDYGNLHKILELRVVINEKLHFKRTRKKVVLPE